MPYNPLNPLAGFSMGGLNAIPESQMTGKDPRAWATALQIIGATMRDMGGAVGGRPTNALGQLTQQQEEGRQRKQQELQQSSLATVFMDSARGGGMPDIKALAPILSANPQFAGPVLEMLKQMQPEKMTPYQQAQLAQPNLTQAQDGTILDLKDPSNIGKNFAKPAEAKVPTAPQTRTRHDGDKEIIEQFNPQTGGYDKISEAPRWQPNAPAAAGEKESWGQPISEAGPDGKPIQVRYGNRLGREVVEGAVPAPRTRAPAAKMINDLVKVGTNVENLGRLKDTFEDRFGGNVVLGDMANTMGRTFGDSTGQAQWWQDYQSYINVVRNELFGAALTDTEKAEFEKSIITPRMNAQEARKNLTRQHELAGKAARRQAKPYLAAGYDREAIEGALGMGVDEVNDAAKPKLPQGGGVLAPPGGAAVPAGAVSMLKQNPALAAAFDAKYGPGASRQYLGQ